MAIAYKPSQHPKLIIEAFLNGYSEDSLAGALAISQKTFDAWVKKYPKMREALVEGKAAERFYWEQVGLDGMSGKIKGFNHQVWLATMRARFGYTETTKVEQDLEIKIKFVD